MAEEGIEEEPVTLYGIYDEDDLPSAKLSPPQVELDLVREDAGGHPTE